MPINLFGQRYYVGNNNSYPNSMCLFGATNPYTGTPDTANNQLWFQGFSNGFFSDSELVSFGGSQSLGGHPGFTCGFGNTHTAANTYSLGNTNTINQTNSICIGEANTIQSGYDKSIIIGFNNTSQSQNGVMIGTNLTTSAACASYFLMGYGSSIGVNNAVGIGTNQAILGYGSTGIGWYTSPVNNFSVVLSDNSSTTLFSDNAANQFAARFVGGYYLTGGSLDIATVGSGISIAEGTNGRQGVATLVSGTIGVFTSVVTANSRIFLTPQDNNSGGAIRVSSRTPGVGFTITSSNNGDNGVVAYEIFEPG